VEISTPSNHPFEAVSRSTRSSEDGGTLLEMTIAMLLLTIGLLAVASSISYAFMVSNKGRNITNSKLLVVSILEQMETLRNTKQLTFGQISNAGAVDNTGATQSFSGFPTGFQPVSINPGPDGIFGTGDDLIDPGSGGVYGDGNDVTNTGWAISGYTREIVITSLSSNLKRIQVTLKYPGDRGQMETRVGVSYLNNDARSNFLP